MKTPEQADPPTWKDGDVIAYTFKKADGTAGPKEYSYARMDGHWPGERDWSSLSDEDVADAWSEGRAYLLRSGVEEAALPALDAISAASVETELRIALRRLNNTREILRQTAGDRPLYSFIDELWAVLGE